MSRLEWALGAILALVLIAALVLTLIYWSQRQTNSEISPVTPPTARLAFERAAPVARGWAADAALLSASATWQDGAALRPEEVGWSLVFYSVERASTALIAVTDGQPALVSEQRQELAYDPAALSGWTIDSEAAVARALQLGGQRFLEEQGSATLVLTLNMDNDPVWAATFIHAEDGRAFAVHFDATTGEVINVQQSLEGERPLLVRALGGG
jgi:hypothetical protein